MEEKKFRKTLELGRVQALLLDAKFCLEDFKTSGDSANLGSDLSKLFKLRPTMYDDMKAMINRHLNNVYCDINNL